MTSEARRRDEIDAIVDDILAAPERAEELKRLLRARLARLETAHGRPRLRLVKDDRGDPDTFWDNVPV